MKQLFPLATFLLISLAAFSVNGQESAARAEFDTVFTEWKSLLENMRLLQTQAQEAEEAELPAMKEQYAQLVDRGVEMIPRLRDAAIATYLEQPNEDPQVARWLLTIAKDYVETDRFDEAIPALDALVEGKSTNPEVNVFAGVAAFCTEDFEKAKKHLTMADAAGILPPKAQPMLADVDSYIEFWEEEQAARAASATGEAGSELPLVKLETSKGDIVLELFEDDAPETVGNFVSLVEKGYYDGLTFHRVIEGFVAQAGCPAGDGSGGPGYSIYCECHQENYRKHFRGSVSMAHSGRDTGGSQFFLTFAPASHLNGKHTVFGRVVEGLDVLPKLQRRDPTSSRELAIVPDKILKAEVVRKRDHKYLPNKVK